MQLILDLGDKELELLLQAVGKETRDRRRSVLTAQNSKTNFLSDPVARYAYEAKLLAQLGDKINIAKADAQEAK
jgi:hypothetical protein